VHGTPFRGLPLVIPSAVEGSACQWKARHICARMPRLRSAPKKLTGRVARPNLFDRACWDAFHRTGRHAQAALGRATQRNVPWFLPDTSREAQAGVGFVPREGRGGCAGVFGLHEAVWCSRASNPPPEYPDGTYDPAWGITVPSGKDCTSGDEVCHVTIGNFGDDNRRGKGKIC